jgi:hypothetical protein
VVTRGRRIVGLDLGQSRDPTALVVLESEPSAVGPSVTSPDRPSVPGPATRSALKPRVTSATASTEAWQIRHIERYPLNRPYPEYVAHTIDLMRTPELRGAPLIIDFTGVGRPVFDMFVASGLTPFGIQIVGGTSVIHKGRIWNVPKRDLATSVLMLMQSRRVRVSSHIYEAQVLIQELLNFRIKISLSGNDQYEAWREGDHDDLVLATACAAWVGLHVPIHALYPQVGGSIPAVAAYRANRHLDPRFATQPDPRTAYMVEREALLGSPV